MTPNPSFTPRPSHADKPVKASKVFSDKYLVLVDPVTVKTSSGDEELVRAIVFREIVSTLYLEDGIESEVEYGFIRLVAHHEDEGVVIPVLDEGEELEGIDTVCISELPVNILNAFTEALATVPEGVPGISNREAFRELFRG